MHHQFMMGLSRWNGIVNNPTSALYFIDSQTYSETIIIELEIIQIA